MKKYVLDFYTLKVSELEVIGETASYVTIPAARFRRERKEKKYTQHHCIFDTFAEAKAEAIVTAKRRLDNATERVKHCEAMLRKTSAIDVPEPEGN